jgi:hypothetical protein
VLRAEVEKRNWHITESNRRIESYANSVVAGEAGFLPQGDTNVVRVVSGIGTSRPVFADS